VLPVVHNMAFNWLHRTRLSGDARGGAPVNLIVRALGRALSPR